MVYPLNNNTDPFQTFTYYQGVVVSELICTVTFFVFLQAFHFCLWGHDQQIWQWKKNEEGEAGLEPLPISQWKWNQKGWNMYFSIIFGNHVSSVFLPMAYLPNIFTCVVSYCHFGCFLGMLINQIFMNQKQRKGGNKTTNRVFWVRKICFYLVMCIFNVLLIGAGLYGIPQVIR